MQTLPHHTRYIKQRASSLSFFLRLDNGEFSHDWRARAYGFVDARNQSKALGGTGVEDQFASIAQ